MGKIRQTKRSCNTAWTDILYHNNEGPGSSAANAIALTFDASPVNFQLTAGRLTWVKWTNAYNDQVDFWLYRNGLFTIPVDISYFKVYDTNATTLIDLSSSNATAIDSGTGPDPETRQGYSAFFNFYFLSGQTYYATFIPPFTGTYGIEAQGD